MRCLQGNAKYIRMQSLEACVRVGGGVARQIPQGSSPTPDVWETLLYRNPGREMDGPGQLPYSCRTESGSQPPGETQERSPVSTDGRESRAAARTSCPPKTLSSYLMGLTAGMTRLSRSAGAADQGVGLSAPIYPVTPPAQGSSHPAGTSST